jgi:dienelactone hydrolase
VGNSSSHRIAAFALVLLFGAVLVGCYPLAVRDGEAPAGASASSLTGAVTSATGCRLDYRLYRPSVAETDGLVVLAHGFLRGKERMHGLARALAAAGMPTVTLDLCNQRPWDGGHYRNGLDMVAIARALEAPRVLYAGFSAGGLAALVAARQDPSAVGVLALDLVEDRKLGERTARGLDKPLIGLMGEPSACNAEGNGVAVIAASPLGRVESVPGAGHCEFESPTDWLCRLVCPSAGRYPDLLRKRIITASVSAARDLLKVGYEGSEIRVSQRTKGGSAR